ncbi:hypothetical protein [Myxococcus sp. AS-1-15]|uniref:hypothetical protein n=1 Tax=Myxococcus sp. AS-1-15 TaxID=2874600 RepID=UPI001CBCE238|nr:hypothetical protein [Myxococcus sp. AS-1-15]MBZ4402006.1 hypothetical protein [Myxococcus sp. AS-1-15]
MRKRTGRAAVIPGKKTPKPAGPKKRVVTFKPDADVADYIDAMVASGTRQTDVIEDSIRIVRDLAATLGVEGWAELVKRATVREVTEGVIAGELVAPALEVDRMTGHEPKPGAKKGRGT